MSHPSGREAWHCSVVEHLGTAALMSGLPATGSAYQVVFGPSFVRVPSRAFVRLYVPPEPWIAAPLPALTVPAAPAGAPFSVMSLSVRVGLPLTTKMREVPPPSMAVFCATVLKPVIGGALSRPVPLSGAGR